MQVRRRYPVSLRARLHDRLFAVGDRVGKQQSIAAALVARQIVFGGVEHDAGVLPAHAGAEKERLHPAAKWREACPPTAASNTSVMTRRKSRRDAARAGSFTGSVTSGLASGRL